MKKNLKYIIPIIIFIMILSVVFTLNKDNEKVGIDWTNDTYDRGVHVNIYGSKKATAYIGEILKTDYSLTDHRTDTKYADWQKDYEKAGLY